MDNDKIAAERIKKLFRSNGGSLAAWAKEMGFKTHDVYAVLDGRTRGSRGESHRIAVALGLKEGNAGAGNRSQKEIIQAINDQLHERKGHPAN
ncbi:helix-turn-helix domain-containing protein [Herbaspirillum frisingense]|uniref:DNA-binding protein n=1 Tax=Herbaspirillum frisingense TaxID=92645 RepID=UPI001F452ADC|nr:DNA-binding protein [Herbaspirillum frisingense]UIN21184.1 DNA-binding protein [Herbaspirillum frisingense]